MGEKIKEISLQSLYFSYNERGECVSEPASFLKVTVTTGAVASSEQPAYYSQKNQKGEIQWK